MPRKKQEEIKTEKILKETASPRSYYHAVGRRKTAVARVKLEVLRNGAFMVNGKPVEEYFPGEVAKRLYLEPFRISESLGRFNVSVKVEGSGKSAQIGAVVHGIARALQEVNKEQYRPILKKRGLLTRDPRAKERRKAGLAHKARARKQSPKR